MKKFWTWQLALSLILIGASVVMYALHYLLFRDLKQIFYYLIEDIGALFIYVLLVILFIERLLARRERRALLKKLNMAIGAFFSEVGLELLKRFSGLIEKAEVLERQLEIGPKWGKREFSEAMAAARDFDYQVRITPAELKELDEFLSRKRPFLLRLLENPNLLEHETFTDLLWAVSHAQEELSFREKKFEGLPESDYRHLAGDLKRAYSQLISQWIAYNSHLKASYPYLFSLTARINPLNPAASPIVRA